MTTHKYYSLHVTPLMFAPAKLLQKDIKLLHTQMYITRPCSPPGPEMFVFFVFFSFLTELFVKREVKKGR